MRSVPAVATQLGLSMARDSPPTGTYTTAANGANDIWLSSYGEVTGYLAVDLGQQYTLDHLLFWNYQGDLARPQRGLKTADVYVCLDANPGFDFTNTTEWTLLLDDQVFNIAPGQNGVDFSQQVALGSAPRLDGWPSISSITTARVIPMSITPTMSASARSSSSKRFPSRRLGR